MQIALFSDRDREIEIQGTESDGSVRIFIHGHGFECVQKADILRIGNGKDRHQESNATNSQATVEIGCTEEI